MFYAIKVIENLIYPPGLFILIVLLAGLWALVRGERKAIGAALIVMSAVFYALSSPMVANALVSPLERKYPQPRHPSGDVLVMLGGGAVYGNPDINGKGNPTGDAANRLLTTARLYKALHLPIILTSGPLYQMNGHQTSEPLIERRELEMLGIPKREILLDSQSTNTQENALNTGHILLLHHFRQPILITSAYHMERSVLDFKRVGIKVTPYPTDYQVNTENLLYSFPWLPSPNGLSLTALALHEYVGIFATRLGVRG